MESTSTFLIDLIRDFVENEFIELSEYESILLRIEPYWQVNTEINDKGLVTQFKSNVKKIVFQLEKQPITRSKSLKIMKLNKIIECGDLVDEAIPQYIRTMVRVKITKLTKFQSETTLEQELNTEYLKLIREHQFGPNFCTHPLTSVWTDNNFADKFNPITHPVSPKPTSVKPWHERM